MTSIEIGDPLSKATQHRVAAIASEVSASQTSMQREDTGILRERVRESEKVIVAARDRKFERERETDPEPQ